MKAFRGWVSPFGIIYRGRYVLLLTPFLFWFDLLAEVLRKGPVIR